MWEKVKALSKEGKIAYSNYKSIVDRERNDPQALINATGLISVIIKSEKMPPNSSFEFHSFNPFKHSVTLVYHIRLFVLLLQSQRLKFLTKL